jgi:hypothetical protein
LAPRARSKVKMKKRNVRAREKARRARERCAHASRASTNGRGFRDRIDVPPADGRPDIVSFQKNCGRKRCGELKKKRRKLSRKYASKTRNVRDIFCAQIWLYARATIKTLHYFIINSTLRLFFGPIYSNLRSRLTFASLSKSNFCLAGNRFRRRCNRLRDLPED